MTGRHDYGLCILWGRVAYNINSNFIVKLRPHKIKGLVSSKIYGTISLLLRWTTCRWTKAGLCTLHNLLTLLQPCMSYGVYYIHFSHWSFVDLFWDLTSSFVYSWSKMHTCTVFTYLGWESSQAILIKSFHITWSHILFLGIHLVTIMIHCHHAVVEENGCQK